MLRDFSVVQSGAIDLSLLILNQRQLRSNFHLYLQSRIIPIPVMGSGTNRSGLWSDGENDSYRWEPKEWELRGSF